jgi:rhamnulokinase
MALAIRAAVRDAVRLSGRPVEVVHVVGGGVGNALFCQLVADACGLPVLAGPAEAASWGNAVAQAQALGAVAPGLAAAREVVRSAVAPVRYLPHGDASRWAAAAELVGHR